MRSIIIVIAKCKADMHGSYNLYHGTHNYDPQSHWQHISDVQSS